MEAFGKTIRAGGSCISFKAESTRRFMLCRFTESRAVFLETTTAYPLPFLGRTSEKFFEEWRIPLLRASGKSARGNCSLRGNTFIQKRQRDLLFLRDDVL